MKDHFDGKDVLEHLREARTKGSVAASEIHGTEMPGYLSACADSAKETSLLLLLFWILLSPCSWYLYLLFSAALLIWKTARSALLGWARLERLHRLIEEEKWEIEHNREQEKEELTALYRLKGLKGKLLEEVISVLMADDNRLLRIMLEEELGVTLEIHEHPLKQAFGAFLGTLGAALCFFLGLWVLPSFGPFLFSGSLLGVASYSAAKLEKNRSLESTIWNLSCAFFALGIVYFLKRILL